MNINIKDGRNRNPLELAISQEKQKHIKILIKHGAKSMLYKDFKDEEQEL